VPPPAAALVETHISWVLLTEDHAIKVLKPLRTDVLDHRSLDARRHACELEVDLNRRLAPDVYEGVGEICLDGESIEPVIVMRRMPSARRLSALLGEPEAPTQVRAVARTIASFHARLEPLPRSAAERVASQGALRRRWEVDVAGLRQIGAGLVDTEVVDEISDRAATYLSGRAPLLEERIRSGMVRDVHGDLLADDIFCLDDGPRVLDCLAFSPTLRHGDVLSDVAFLAMDLERLGSEHLAHQLLGDYWELSNERHPASLAHFYIAHRALVRAKVGALRSQQDPAAADAVGPLSSLALDHLRRAEIHLTLVGGAPGSGKSTLADTLADQLGWVVLSSDAVRRDLGLRSVDLEATDAYRPESTSAVYDELVHRASELISRGDSVVVDATWTSEEERRKARAAASAAHTHLIELRCDAPMDVCRDRVARRAPGASLSEASPDVVDLLAERADPWHEAITIDTSGDGAPHVAPPSRLARPWFAQPPPEGG